MKAQAFHITFIRECEDRWLFRVKEHGSFTSYLSLNRVKGRSITMNDPVIYGESLYSLAKDEGLADKTLDELKSIGALFSENPDYVKILDSPRIDKIELMHILNEDFMTSVSGYTLSFLKILSEKHMVHFMPKCVKAYEKLYNDDHNITVATVTTAKPLSAETTVKLIKKLEEKTGGTVKLRKRVDESAIGGIIIETDNMRIDKSLKGSLEEIKKALT